MSNTVSLDRVSHSRTFSLVVPFSQPTIEPIYRELVSSRHGKIPKVSSPFPSPPGLCFSSFLCVADPLRLSHFRESGLQKNRPSHLTTNLLLFVFIKRDKARTKANTYTWVSVY